MRVGLEKFMRAVVTPLFEEPTGKEQLVFSFRFYLKKNLVNVAIYCFKCFHKIFYLDPQLLLHYKL